MRRLGGSALALVVVLGALLAGLGTASAQDDDSALSVREVDATDPAAVQITFSYAGDRNDLTDLAVREAGNLVDTTTAVPLDDQQSLGIVLAIDASGSMQEGALIERVLEAAAAFIDQKAASDQIAIVTFNNETRVVQGFTTDKAVLTDALDDIALEAETALYDGIVRSAALFADSELQPNIVVFSDGEDSISASSAEQGPGLGGERRRGSLRPGRGELRLRRPGRHRRLTPVAPLRSPAIRLAWARSSTACRPPCASSTS